MKKIFSSHQVHNPWESLFHHHSPMQYLNSPLEENSPSVGNHWFIYVLKHLRVLDIDEGRYTHIKCTIMSPVAVEISRRNFRQV